MTLNPRPLVLQVTSEKEALRESYKRETELYAAGFVNRAADCPNAPLRKVIVFCREIRRTARIEIPAICDCNNTRFRMGIGTKQCKAVGGCPVSKELFPEGVFSS